MGRRSSPPPAPKLAPPPPPKELEDFVENITGVEVKTGINPATGKKYRMTQSLPRSPEAQQAWDTSGRLINETMAEMERLYRYRPDTIVDSSPFINFLNGVKGERQNDLAALTGIPDMANYVREFKNAEIAILDRNFNQYENEVMADLNSGGYGSSSAASQTRAALAYERARAEQELNRDAIKYGYDSAEREIARNRDIYNFREAGRVGQIGAEEAKYALLRDQAHSANEQYNRDFGTQLQTHGVASDYRERDINNRLKGAMFAGNQALAENNAANNAQYSAYNGYVNQQVMQHKMNMDNYNNQPPTLGQQLMTAGGMLAGGMIGGPMGASVGGSMASGMPMQNNPMPNNFSGWGNNLWGNTNPIFARFAPSSNNNMPVVQAQNVGNIKG